MSDFNAILHLPWHKCAASIVFIFFNSMICHAQLGTLNPDFGTELPRLPFDFATEQEQPEAMLEVLVDGRAAIIYDDNVLRSPSNEEDDFIAVIAPRISLISNTDDYRWRLIGEVEAGKYDSVSDNDYVDVELDFDSTWIVHEDIQIRGLAGFRDDHQPIGSSVDEPERLAADTTDFQQAEAKLTITYTPALFFIESDSAAIWYDYDNNHRRDGSEIFNDDRDRIEFEQLFKVGYSATIVQPYLFGAFNIRSYDKNVDGVELFDRDSDGYSVGVGAQYGNKGDDLIADLRIGHLSQDYQARSLKNISDAGFEASIYWQALPRLRVAGNASRSIKETTLTNASSYLDTDFRLTATYQMQPDVDLYIKARYEQRDFQVQNAGSNAREDDFYQGTLGLTWRLPNDFYFDAHYDYSERDSNTPNVEYNSQAVNVGLGMDF